MSYYLEQIHIRPLPDDCAMKAFLKTSGDTLGVVYVLLHGGFSVWRSNINVGTFSSVKNAGYALEKLEARQREASHKRRLGASPKKVDPHATSVRCSQRRGDCHHIVIRGQTLCGRAASDWSVLDGLDVPNALSSAYCCGSCKKTWNKHYAERSA